MSFKCELKVADKTFEVIQCLLPVSQRRNQRGRPASGVRAEEIELILEGTDDGTLSTWMADPTKKQDGNITFFRIDQDSRFKEIDFEGAYMMTLVEYFTVGNRTADFLGMQTDYFSPEVDDIEVADDALKKSLNRLLYSQARTGMSYCTLVRISAERIKIDGVEHQN
jgi:Hemolysin coregulated protein Hcp (TssD)